MCVCAFCVFCSSLHPIGNNCDNVCMCVHIYILSAIDSMHYQLGPQKYMQLMLTSMDVSEIGSLIEGR